MKRKSIWVTGASGSIGSKLVEELSKDWEMRIIATDKDVDITNLEEVTAAAELYKPTVIINCASLSDPQYCEEHRLEAFRVNTLGARNLASVSARINAKLIHMSTDDVFSGEHNRSKSEFDLPTPITVYGQSKYAGEQQIKELNPKHLIIRSSWVYGVEGDYVSYVMEKGARGEAFEAYLDRISTPTNLNQIVKFIMKMINEREYGVFHVSAEGMCTRREYAAKILSCCGYDSSLAVGSFSKEGGAVVSTVLENLMMNMTGVYEMPLWEKDLEEYIAGLKEEK